MPKGIILCGWDNILGTIIEACFPPNLSMGKDKSVQYLIAIQQIGKSPVLQIQDDDQITLVFGIPPQISGKRQFSLNFIVLYLNASEGKLIQSFKDILRQGGEQVVTAPQQIRTQMFQILAKRAWNLNIETKLSDTLL